jgi:hypothetical protein
VPPSVEAPKSGMQLGPGASCLYCGEGAEGTEHTKGAMIAATTLFCL